MILASYCLILTVAVLGLLVWPLWRGTGVAAAEGGDYDLTVYKDQLADLARDLDQGAIDREEAELLRVEIQRRILRVDLKPAEKTATAAKRPWSAIAATIAATTIGTAGLYLILGAPKVADQPFAARAGQIQEMQAQTAKVELMVDQLASRLQDNPDDGKGWAMLGRSLRVLRQHDRAKSAYERALPLLPNDIQVRLEYGSLLVEDLPSDAALPETFVTVMRDVLAIDPDVPDALYYVGLAESEAGHRDKAKALWTILLNKIPAESPDRAEMQKQIDALK